MATYYLKTFSYFSGSDEKIVKTFDVSSDAVAIEIGENYYSQNIQPFLGTGIEVLRKVGFFGGKTELVKRIIQVPRGVRFV